MASPNGGVTVGGDPHAGKVVGVDLVVEELAPPVLVDVDAARLSVVDLTLDDGRVGPGLHLKACDPIVVDVIAFKVAL